jgi:hypothetical protein
MFNTALSSQQKTVAIFPEFDSFMPYLLFFSFVNFLLAQLNALDIASSAI